MKQLQPNEYAAYQMNYIRLVPEEDIVKGLISQKEEMLHFFTSIPTFKQEYRYAPNKWTIKDIILHLIDAERIFAYRALRIARNDATPLPGFDENDYVINAKANERDFESLLHEYSAVRNATISLFEHFTELELKKLGNASHSSVSVRGIGYCILGHELHHKNIIVERYL
ncbi:DinB family protein [Flavobacterium cucumis]|uniref:DinB superfamily protein n=1 Tax=Flavobacterium cucumis TaxID=416016 RepID=A0A1M7ZZ61_9FLAO|nr:DinB family protein [Flavobacterium cucumis]SHO74162.1 DinB superfamily protein [Flavobacterium cucumis]